MSDVVRSCDTNARLSKEEWKQLRGRSHVVPETPSTMEEKRQAVESNLASRSVAGNQATWWKSLGEMRHVDGPLCRVAHGKEDEPCMQYTMLAELEVQRTINTAESRDSTVRFVVF